MVASVEFGVMAWACCLHRDADLPARPASMCFEAFGGLVFRVYSGNRAIAIWSWLTHPQLSKFRGH